MDETKENKSEVKKGENAKKNKLIIQALAIIVGIFLILLIGDSTLGNGVFGWLNQSKPQEVIIPPVEYNGLLAGSLTGDAVANLENYEAMYNTEGKLIYELIDNGKKINIGEGYNATTDNRDLRTVLVSFSENNLQQRYITCGCVGPKCLSSAKDPCRINKEEQFICEGTYTLGETEGACRFIPKSWM